MNSHAYRPFTLLAFLILSCGGCASPWEKNFESSPESAGQKSPPASSVEIRTIPFERWQAFVDREHRRRVESATAPSELRMQDQRAEKNRMLETLQVKERGDDIVVLGWSEFTSDEKLNPNDPRLQKFAQ